MRALVNIAPGILHLEERPLPEPRSGQVRIRTLACGICATDLEMIAGWERTGFPSIPGHEWCGIVEATGAGVDASLVGMRCVGDNVLADGGEVGFEHPGGYAEAFLTQAANLRSLPPNANPTTATLIEPLAVCLRALRRLRPVQSERALVVGDGAIGLLMGLGACAAYDYHGTGLPERLDRAYPIAVEASGTKAGLQTALAAASNEGRIAILGDYADACADFRWNDLLHRELAIMGSNAGTGAWDEAAERFDKLSGALRHLVTHAIPVCDHARALDLVRTRHDGALRVVLTWPPTG
jgi:threonine dehydrogenase-like Zn-dependent dehydrogenase